MRPSAAPSYPADGSSLTGCSGWPRVRIELDSTVRMLDRRPPAARRVARRERVGGDLIDVVPARAETLDRAPRARDGGGIAHRIARGVLHSPKGGFHGILVRWSIPGWCAPGGGATDRLQTGGDAPTYRTQEPSVAHRRTVSA